jgi:cysteine desulfurase/selenocysteine lyase
MEIRKEFPELETGVVFLDNAASTLKPMRVTNAMYEFSSKHYANVHRGAYKLSMEASMAYDKARETVARFINAKPSEVVFTYNSTDSIRRLAIILYGNNIISRGDEILLTQAEHHSNILPWVGIARAAGAKVKFLPVNSEGVPKWDLLEDYINERTRILSFGHVSNVTGSVAPVKDIARKAKEKGLLVALDSAQGVPHLSINVRELGIDFLAFSGHKMLGPTGIGVLWMREELANSLQPVLGGGGTIKDVRLVGQEVEVDWDVSPLKWEPGTPPIIEAVGLGEAVNYLSRIGMDNISRHEEVLTKLLFDLLQDELKDKIRILGPLDPRRRLGIVSFTVDKYSVDAVALYLSSKGIAVRTGKHCAHPLHYALKADKGSVRASMYLYNTEEEIRYFVDTLKNMVS